VAAGLSDGTLKKHLLITGQTFDVSYYYNAVADNSLEKIYLIIWLIVIGT
jgi:hypothetical protein